METKDTTDNINLIRKLYQSKLRILSDHGFFGAILMNMKFAFDTTINENEALAATDGEYIYFHPNTLAKLSDIELDIIMLHELLHVILKHCIRGKEYNQMLFNIAADIVVNSHILESHPDRRDIMIQGNPIMHLAPDGNEGCLYSVEEVYEMFLKQLKKNGGKGKVKMKNKVSNKEDNNKPPKNNGNNQQDDEIGDGKEYTVEQLSKDGCFDSHDKWKELDSKNKNETSAKIEKMVQEAYESTKNMTKQGKIPGTIQKYIEELNKPTIDWRIYLNNFVQEDIVDYTFEQPDRRFSTSDFILPSFAEPEEVVKNIVFMVDTSGSMTDEEIVECYSEINGAINQYDGRLEGYIGLFDACVHSFTKFEQNFDVKTIRCEGRGGTNYECIFDYISEKLNNDKPKQIIILTDGYCDFPEEKYARGIPVLWIINNKEVEPPWGKVARLVKK